MNTIAKSAWQSSKLLVKGLLIGLLVLLLMIPKYFVQELVIEREGRQREAFTEISGKWAGRQNITGPVLVLPYTGMLTNEKGQQTQEKKLAYFLPDSLSIESTVNPEKRHRGIFQVMLYSAQIKLRGKFNPLPFQQLQLDPSTVLWNEAYVCMDLEDSKGLNEEIKMTWGNSSVILNPSQVDNGVMKEGFVSPVEISPGQEINFSANLSINGSGQLLFTPVGKETMVKLSSGWPDPSFTGGQLPDHQITEDGFIATWKSLAHTRNFPQAWKESAYNLQSASFGADLFIAVNGYQKTLRSVKYGALCILLTFAAFFIIEMINGRSVHPFQYGLIGLALILFYTLLLSISEYTGFNTAYLVASVCTIGLVAWFVKGVLQSPRLTAILGIVLVLMYAYIFSILQLHDYSLLLGSIGLFLALAVVMHFSRRIQW